MPAQSGDPIAAAIHTSLVPVRKCARGESDTGAVCATARLVLNSCVAYERSPSLDSTAVLSHLRSKYIVLGPGPVMGAANGRTADDQPKKMGSKCAVPILTAKDSVGGGAPATLPVPRRVLYPPESVQLGWKGSTPVGSGFVNLGNTCYLNSTLQALFHVPAFVNWLLNDTAHTAKCELMNGMTHSECLICAMVKTLQCSHKCTGSAIKPLQIYSKLKSICKHLVHGHQEDAHEFLRYLIEGMEKSYLNIFNGLKLDTYSKETTPLNQIFGGYIRTEVTCLECHYVSTTFQHFQDLLLDIRQASSVEEALDSYFGRERLGDGEQAYKCEQCHRRVAATKKFSLERPPKALCVQLKRFGALGGKNTKHINLKQYLDLGRYRHKGGGGGGCNEALRYRLVAMVTHLGPSSSCGHYTAVGQSAVGSYYLFDDSVVRPLSVHNVLATNAYIIMYEQESSGAQQPQHNQQQPNVQQAQETPLKSPPSNGYLNGTDSVRPSSTISSVQAAVKVATATSPSPVSPQPTQSERPMSSPVVQTRFSLCEPRSVSVAPPSAPRSVEKPPPPPQSPRPVDRSPPPPPPPPPAASPASPSSRSLVPYLSESTDDSESEASSLTSPDGSASPPDGASRNNGHPRHRHHHHHHHHRGRAPLAADGNQGRQLPNTTANTPRMNKLSLNGRGVVGPSSTPLKVMAASLSPRVVETDSAQHSWEVTPAARLPAPSPTGSVDSSSGRWSVTSSERDKSSEKGTQQQQSSVAGKQQNGGMNDPKVVETITSGNSNNNSNNNNNYISTNDKAWDGNRHNSTVGQLLKMSHRGYGTGNVNSWNGNRSDMDRETDVERIQMKRSHSNSSYDDELDRGKVKKQKKYHHQFKEERHNRFQEFQNRKNCGWGGGGGGGGRQNFYRQYTYERSRGHQHHHHYYNNNNNRWRN